MANDGTKAKEYIEEKENNKHMLFHLCPLTLMSEQGSRNNYTPSNKKKKKEKA